MSLKYIKCEAITNVFQAGARGGKFLRLKTSFNPLAATVNMYLRRSNKYFTRLISPQLN